MDDGQDLRASAGLLRAIPGELADEYPHGILDHRHSQVASFEDATFTQISFKFKM